MVFIVMVNIVATIIITIITTYNIITTFMWDVTQTV